MKYKRGDFVSVDLDNPESNYCSKTAIVLSSYRDQFGHGSTDIYTIMFLRDGKLHCACSWFHDERITPNGSTKTDEEIQGIYDEFNERQRLYSSIEWIVANWKDTPRLPMSSMTYLMSRLGITKPYGNHGEFIDFFNNWDACYNVLDSIMSVGNVDEINKMFDKIEKVESFVISNNLYSGENADINRVPDSWKKK